MRDQRTLSNPLPPHRLLMLVIPLTITLHGCGGGSSGGGYGGTTTAAPTVTMAFNSSSISLGQSSTLTWSSSGASSCTASGAWSGSQATSGTQAVTPTAVGAETFTLTCMGAGGSTPQSAGLTVTTANTAQYTLTNLVANVAGTSALSVDPNLVNPWGVSMAPGDPVWVANNGSQTSTLYDGNGKAQPVSAPLIVKMPTAAGNVAFGPTGVVAYTGAGFVVSAGGKSGPSEFIYAGTSGLIAGWAPSADPINAVTAYTDAGGALYSGLAIASNAGAEFLYAADFHNNKIDVFNTTFQKQTVSATSFTFADPTLPAGYAPFGIQAIPNGSSGAAQIYVAYAQQKAPDNRESNVGAGLGLVDVFDANGKFLTHLVPVGGALNSPWGIALAPKDFGALSNEVLVGNLGDGVINAYDPASGKFNMALSDSKGNAIATPGLWGIAFGNDSSNQPHNTLFFAAGINGGAGGSYGRIDAGATPPTLNQAPVVTITAPLPSGGGGYGGGGTISGTVAATATVTDSIAITKVQFFAGTTLIGTATTAPYTVQWDTTKTANGSVALTATATDEDGNVGTSAKDNLTVSNSGSPPPPAATLSQLQAQIFGPICSGCHSGVGTTLPGVQNLTSAAATHASLVGVASIEQPGLDRVKAGDPTNSYVIHKLEGAAGITGSRMPLGGPYLSQAQIDQISSWITAGALNN